MKKHYALCLIFFSLYTVGLELSEPIANALKAKELQQIEQNNNSIKEVKNEVPQNKERKQDVEKS